MPSIKDVSEEELAVIVGYLQGKDDGENPTVVVGGGAVYAYNPYEKSTDIDIVVRSKRRTRLLHWLRDQHGYEEVKKQEAGWRAARKVVPGVGTMVLDVAGHEEPQRLEGTADRLDFDLVRNHHVLHRFPAGEVRIPSRSLMVLYKSKAVHDRSTRLANRTSEDPGYDQDKLVKDRSDILALVDAPGHAWDLDLLGTTLARLPALVDALRHVPDDGDAVERYGSMTREQARGQIEELLSLVT